MPDAPNHDSQHPAPTQLFVAATATARRLTNSLLHTIERTFERRRLAQIFAVTLASITISIYVVSVVRRAESARRQWGDTVEVLVASSTLRDGDVISSANSRVARIPAALTVRDALNGQSGGSRVTRQVNANQVLSALDIATTSSNVPAGWRIVAFPVDVVTPQLRAGDRVDVVALGLTVANDALVVSPASQDRGAEIAVPLEVAATVAGAVANGDASLVTAR